MAGSSTGSSAGDFLADPGPDFDPKSAPAAPEPEPEEVAGELEQWDEKRVREILSLQGELTHALLAVGPDDTETWLQTDKDLGTMAPPLTRILNRYDMTRAAAVAGDEALLAAGLVRYGTRNYVKRRRLIAAQQTQEPQPVTGEAAPEGTGPEHDPDWRGVDEDAPPALTPKGVTSR